MELVPRGRALVARKPEVIFESPPKRRMRIGRKDKVIYALLVISCEAFSFLSLAITEQGRNLFREEPFLTVSLAFLGGFGYMFVPAILYLMWQVHLAGFPSGHTTRASDEL